MKQLQPTHRCVDCLMSMAKDVITFANADSAPLIAKAERISRDIQSIPAASFYLFKVKCEPIQNYIQALGNSFMALWKDGK